MVFYLLSWGGWCGAVARADYRSLSLAAGGFLRPGGQGLSSLSTAISTASLASSAPSSARSSPSTDHLSLALLFLLMIPPPPLSLLCSWSAATALAVSLQRQARYTQKMIEAERNTEVAQITTPVVAHRVAGLGPSSRSCGPRTLSHLATLQRSTFSTSCLLMTTTRAKEGGGKEKIVCLSSYQHQSRLQGKLHLGPEKTRQLSWKTISTLQVFPHPQF